MLVNSKRKNYLQLYYEHHLKLNLSSEVFVFSLSELFDNYMQQDAHEFLNYLLNTIADLLQEERKQEKTNGRLANGTLDCQNNNSNANPAPTWVHEIFQGTLTNETRCLTCETVRCSWMVLQCSLKLPT